MSIRACFQVSWLRLSIRFEGEFTLLTFPGGSKSRVNRAGHNVRSDSATIDDMRSIEEWRAAHRAVLNTFQASLRSRTKNRDIVVAQRHKRKNTIFNKLHRHPRMDLSRMDDIAGCRLIFNSIDELYEFRREFHKARFRHRRKNDVDKYDYMKAPKSSGYRGVHDVYSYDVRSRNGERLKGLLIEIQYRTLVQHAWATAVEVIGFITENQPKFQEGDRRYIDCMVYASEILARFYENSRGVLKDLTNEQVLNNFRQLDSEINLLRTLEGINLTETGATKNRNTILVFKPDGSLIVHTYRDSTEALEHLFKLEKQNPDYDIVLVKADSSEEIRLAFRNYFSDAREFISLLSRARSELSAR